MIIKNGFVREDSGRWTSLSEFFSFSVKLTAKGCPDEHCIMGYFKEDGLEPKVVSDGYHDREHAQEALDDAFGYTG